MSVVSIGYVHVNVYHLWNKLAYATLLIMAFPPAKRI
jgi:hypothetical protein